MFPLKPAGSLPGLSGTKVLLAFGNSPATGVAADGGIPSEFKELAAIAIALSTQCPVCPRQK